MRIRIVSRVGFHSVRVVSTESDRSVLTSLPVSMLKQMEHTGTAGL
jgi:hypothetical protein